MNITNYANFVGFLMLGTASAIAYEPVQFEDHMLVLPEDSASRSATLTIKCPVGWIVKSEEGFEGSIRTSTLTCASEEETSDTAGKVSAVVVNSLSTLSPNGLQTISNMTGTPVLSLVRKFCFDPMYESLKAGATKHPPDGKNVRMKEGIRFGTYKGWEVSAEADGVDPKGVALKGTMVFIVAYSEVEHVAVMLFIVVQDSLPNAADVRKVLHDLNIVVKDSPY